jgi:hypothetical protein
MTVRRRSLLWMTRIGLAFLVGVELVFCGKVARIYLTQGLSTVLKYLRRDYMVVGSTDSQIELTLRSPAHPYLNLAILVVCFATATLSLVWLNRRLGQTHQ